MRILIRGNGAGAWMFAAMAAAGGCDVTIAEDALRRSDAGAYFNDKQRQALKKKLPALEQILAAQGRVWTHKDIRRGDEAIRIQTAPVTAISERVLLEGLRAAALAAGCRVVAGANATQFDLVVETEASAPPAGSDSTAAATDTLVGTIGIALEQPTVSMQNINGTWLQATLLPCTSNETIVVVEMDAAASHPTTIDTIFAQDFAGSTFHPIADWQPQSFFHVKQRMAERQVLIGRAAAQGHYGLLADVRIALEDAAALWDAMQSNGEAGVPSAEYQARRTKSGERLIKASKLAADWCRNLPIYAHQPLLQFAFSHLTQHYRVSYESIKSQDPSFVAEVERALTPSRNDAEPIPPMFAPFRLRNMELPNRIVFSPMCMRQGTRDAVPTDFHLVHLGSRATGGAGLVFAEMTAVAPPARISLNCVGLYKDEHTAAWRRITDYIHTQTDSKVAMQLGHAGRKGSTRPTPDAWSVPLDEDGWELLSASAIPYTERAATPRAAEQKDMDEVLDAYVAATHRAHAAGFDMIEIHMAHGYLLSSFITPLSNTRDDAFGGPIENRMRFPMQVFEAVRAAWPSDKPISVRISASDWLPEGIVIEDVVALARMLKDAGCDIMTVSTGNTTSGRGDTKKSSTGNWAPEGRLYQVPFSDRVRNQAGMPTIAVGSILSWGDANMVIAAGRADLCAIARGHLYDPYFVRHAAHAQGYAMKWPSSYRSAAEHKPRGHSQ